MVLDFICVNGTPFPMKGKMHYQHRFLFQDEQTNLSLREIPFIGVTGSTCLPRNAVRNAN